MKCQISVTDIQRAGYISAARASNTQLFCNFYDSSVYRPSCFYCNHSTSCSYSFYSAPCIYSYKYFYCSSVCASLSCKSDVSVFLSRCKYGCFFSYNIRLLEYLKELSAPGRQYKSDDVFLLFHSFL